MVFSRQTLNFGPTIISTSLVLLGKDARTH